MRSSSDVSRNMPIGKVMEYRFKEALDASARYEVLAHGLQIQGAERTLGELDFLLRDHNDGVLWHIEFAYKFYLHKAELGTSPFAPWIGPGMRDRLVYKLEKMAKHQFANLWTPSAERLLAELGLDARNIKQGLTFCAELFLSAGVGQEAIPYPLSKDAASGYWYHISQKPKGRFRVVNKPDWIWPNNTVEMPHLTLAEEQLTATLTEKGYAMCSSGTGHRWFVIR